MDFLSLFVSIAFAAAPVNVTGTSLLHAPAIMLDIAQCESGQRQFDTKGNVIRSRTDDYGYFQINKIWIASSTKNGVDIMTEEGNIKWALHLYKLYGTKPWNSSAKCWKNGGNSA